MQMNNSSNSRKRPLADATLEMNTPKREYYQPFHPYPYMNMMQMHMNAPYTPFSCSPMNSSVLSSTSSNDSGINADAHECTVHSVQLLTNELFSFVFLRPAMIPELVSGSTGSSSCESTPSTSTETKSIKRDDEVLFQVPSRLNHISKNKVTLAELKRRIAAPECLNSSFLGIYLRLAKTKEVGKELRDNLAKHGISLPSGRRKGIQNTVFTCLVEEEATQLGRDMHTLVQQHYPVRPLIDMAARKSVSHPEERRRDLIGAIRILDELNGMFTELQTPLATRIQNNVPIHNELEVGMNHFSLITHTFGPINQSTWCNAFLNYAKMSLAMYQGRGMEQANPQVSPTSLVHTLSVV
ncbi:transcription factor AP-2 [Ostertagia ostertagi]